MNLKEVAAKLNGCAVGDVLAVARLFDGGLVSVVRPGQKRRFTAEEVGAVAQPEPGQALTQPEPSPGLSPGERGAAPGQALTQPEPSPGLSQRERSAEPGQALTQGRAPQRSCGQPGCGQAVPLPGGEGPEAEPGHEAKRRGKGRRK